MDTPERGILHVHTAHKIKDEEIGLDDAAAKEQNASHQQSDDRSRQDDGK
jgi:hypothetical protein